MCDVIHTYIYLLVSKLISEHRGYCGCHEHVFVGSAVLSFLLIYPALESLGVTEQFYFSLSG